MHARTGRKGGRGPGSARRAQATVEYLLVVSVLVMALYYAASSFWGPVKQGFGDMTGDVRRMAAEGYVNGGNP